MSVRIEYREYAGHTLDLYNVANVGASFGQHPTAVLEIFNSQRQCDIADPYLGHLGESDRDIGKRRSHFAPGRLFECAHGFEAEHVPIPALGFREVDYG